MDQNDMERMARLCGGMIIYSANGDPAKVQDLDLHKFCAYLNAYVRLDVVKELSEFEPAKELTDTILKGTTL
jgi:hypothetical protein